MDNDWLKGIAWPFELSPDAILGPEHGEGDWLFTWKFVRSGKEPEGFPPPPGINAPEFGFTVKLSPLPCGPSEIPPGRGR